MFGTGSNLYPNKRTNILRNEQTMTQKADDKVYIVVNKDGVPMYGTKVCSNKGSATRSMAPHLAGILHHQIGYDSPLAEVNREANPGYGIPKPVHDRAIDDLVDKMRNTPNYLHQNGNKSITRSLVEDYNKIITDLTDDWHVAEVGLKSPYKVLKIDLCEECGGHRDVMGVKNIAKRLCKNCRRP